MFLLFPLIESDTEHMSCPSELDVVELKRPADGWTPRTGASVTVPAGARGTVVEIGCPAGWVTIETADALVEARRADVSVVARF